MNPMGMIPTWEITKMETAFRNIARRIAYMKLEMLGGAQFTNAPDYTYVQIPVLELYNPTDEKPVTKALRNQHLKILPACKVDVRKPYKLWIKTNPKLQEVSSCPAMFMLDSDQGEQASFYATFRRDFDVSELDWCVRIYMME